MAPSSGKNICKHNTLQSTPIIIIFKAISFSSPMGMILIFILHIKAKCRQRHLKCILSLRNWKKKL